MAEETPRYAVYAIPGIDPAAPVLARQLRERAEAWFARPSAQSSTVSARRYGFHGTLAAPFRLNDSAAESQLHALVRDLASGTAPVVIPSIDVSALGPFVALVPTRNHEPLRELAASVVRAVSSLRAPLTAADVVRRNPENLTARQRELLTTWGYPFVMDEFQFHMTLTDALPPADRESSLRMLREAFGDVTGRDIELTALSVLIESKPGAGFDVLASHPLTGQEQPCGTTSGSLNENPPPSPETAIRTRIPINSQGAPENQTATPTEPQRAKHHQPHPARRST